MNPSYLTDLGTRNNHSEIAFTPTHVIIWIVQIYEVDHMVLPLIITPVDCDKEDTRLSLS